jgi:hypothetical protein
MKLKLEMDLDNDAFHANPVQHEVIECLQKVIAQLEDQCSWGIIKDTNGNKVGEWDIDSDDGEV